MTEDQARDAARLIKNLDEMTALREKIRQQFKKAKAGDAVALEWITNVSFELLEMNVEHIRCRIAEI